MSVDGRDSVGKLFITASVVAAIDTEIVDVAPVVGIALSVAVLIEAEDGIVDGGSECRVSM